MTTMATQLSLSSIDDYLGPGETRFFSRGYRRTDALVDDVVITPTDDAERDVQATVTVEYPSDWSKKKSGVDLPPHLSTVDMLVLGTQLSEAYLAHTYGLAEPTRRNMWLRRVTLKAGSTPQEELAGMPAQVTCRETEAVPDSPDRFLSVLDCSVGVMQARCEIEHPIIQRVATAGSYGSIEDILGAAAPRYYGEGFKFRRQLIEDVQVDMDQLRAGAAVQIEPTQQGHPAGEGIEGAYQPSVSLVDCFVVNLQMAQVLMYEMDSLTRENSNTLWMIQTILEAEHPDRPPVAPMEARTAIAAKHRLKLRGGTWRNADIEGELGGVTMRASFAHALPQ